MAHAKRVTDELSSRFSNNSARLNGNGRTHHSTKTLRSRNAQRLSSLAALDSLPVGRPRRCAPCVIANQRADAHPFVIANQCRSTGVAIFLQSKVAVAGKRRFPRQCAHCLGMTEKVSLRTSPQTTPRHCFISSCVSTSFLHSKRSCLDLRQLLLAAYTVLAHSVTSSPGTIQIS